MANVHLHPETRRKPVALRQRRTRHSFDLSKVLNILQEATISTNILLKASGRPERFAIGPIDEESPTGKHFMHVLLTEGDLVLAVSRVSFFLPITMIDVNFWSHPPRSGINAYAHFEAAAFTPKAWSSLDDGHGEEPDSAGMSSGIGTMRTRPRQGERESRL
jgi:hypothetical protein